ncbi:class I SAM-dependent methyltransferase [Campylobacter lari]|uniref:Class I SAM-dependent methyltransferase n=1 Tax=Campylobacter lari TaxID=201 RepID=A0A698G244_CAMLA|nr:class I SAM-dependent methyltransferase [Campylobacter lari]ECW8955357.1 class I SAM-dependent methyltransferase [Campylobacter lari]MBT0794904.1 methyltransferase domain-containing protein [Campylobacter lari]MBT0826950.1 methyltransferase domain-containing protein [Campylobacter lari]MBT0831070.1 methyltransferase domain-containing protein [Campylobacter lari]MCR6511230.1 class I SAM-dependent methyltransferase [Campylobacter lari]
MYLKDLKGLKFPDLAVIKFFFKQELHRKNNQKVLEFACSNGNNLSLFANYDYECIGVDLSKENIDNANYNFKNVIQAKKYEFFNDNILEFPLKNPNINADIFMIPNVINYLLREDFLNLLKISKQNSMYKDNALFFLRTRSIKDYRYGYGEKIAHNCFKITNDNTTGELGCINTLYQEYELVEILKEYLNLYDFKVLTYENTNIMGEDEKLVHDSDIVIYGKIK